MTAPYGTNISTLDMHATPRAQDDIYGKVVHRTLYNFDSVKGEPVLELATSVTVSNNGFTHTFKLRDDAFFHNGKKMTADDIIYSFNRSWTANAPSRPRAISATSRARSRWRRGRPPASRA
jgi:peptide/nickel transport system substrate-binding protein